MEQSGFWNFFFATGLPQAYLAARLKEGEEVVFPERRGAGLCPRLCRA